MTRRKVIVWLLFLAVAVAAYLILDEVDRRHAAQQDQANRLVELADPLKVQKIVLGGKDKAQPIVIVRQETAHRWQITSPIDWQAYSLSVGRLLDTLLSSRVERRIEEPGDLAQYGLAPPVASVRLTDASGGEAALDLGQLNPTQEWVYTHRPGESEVWLVKATLRGAVARSLFELRDKTALKFVAADVKGVDLRWGDSELRAERLRGGVDPAWRLSGGAVADPDAVEDLLYKIRGMQTKEFLDEVGDLAQYGLDKPLARVTLNMEAGAGDVGLLIGAAVPGQRRRYARRLEGGPVLQLTDDMLGALAQTDRHALLQRHVLRFDRDRVQSLDIDFGGRRLAFAKRDGQWVRTEPAGGVKEGAAGELFVWDLWDLKWERKLPAGGHGLDQPRAVVAFSEAPAQDGGEPRDLGLTIGAVDRATGLVAVRALGDDAVYGVDKKLLEIVPGLQEDQGAQKDKGEPAQGQAAGEKNNG